MRQTRNATYEKSVSTKIFFFAFPLKIERFAKIPRPLVRQTRTRSERYGGVFFGNRIDRPHRSAEAQALRPGRLHQKALIAQNSPEFPIGGESSQRVMGKRTQTTQRRRAKDLRPERETRFRRGSTRLWVTKRTHCGVAAGARV